MNTPLTEKSPDTSITSDFRRDLNIPSRFTQSFSLNTTVPINIVGSNIGGRHTPTKHALRHSRMIAMSRTGKKGVGHLSVIIKHPTLAKYFVCLQNKIAIIILILSIWMLIQIPNLKDRDIPYWSGGLLLISGLLNSIFLWCCRKKSSNDSTSLYAFYPKIVSLTITILAALTCLCALVFASVHIYVIKTAECKSFENSNTSCSCHVLITNTNDKMDIIDVDSQIYQYPSLSCVEVTGLLAITLIGSAVANAVGVIISLYYVFLHKTETLSFTYSQVPSYNNSANYL